MSNETQTQAQAEQRQRDIRAEVNPDTGILALAFSNGQKIQLHVSEMPDAVRAMATLHGFKQKLVDAAAIARDPATGKSATIRQKYEAVKTVYDRLMSGEWNAERGDGTSGAGLLFQALCRLYEGKRTPDDVRAWLEKKDAKEQAALRANPKVAEIIRTIQAEKVGDKVDSDKLLDELA